MTLYTDELQKAYQAGVNSVLISQTNLNQPGESGPYQDKTTYPKETEGQKLEKEGGYIDSGDPITDDNIGPDGRPSPEDVQEQIRGYGTEQDTMSFLESFINDAVAGVPYTLPPQKLFYKGGDGKVKSMTSPLNFRSDEDTLRNHMLRYGRPFA